MKTGEHRDGRAVLEKMALPEGVRDIVAATSVILPESKDELVDLAMGGRGRDCFSVDYEVDGRGTIDEATVVRCRNGVSVNYSDP